MNPKTHLFRAEGFVVVLLACGYLALTIIALLKWNAEISGALVTGFALFAQSSVTSFFRYMEKQADTPDDPISTTTTTTTIAAPAPLPVPAGPILASPATEPAPTTGAPPTITKGQTTP